jgi:hypothetical protein
LPIHGGCVRKSKKKYRAKLLVPNIKYRLGAGRSVEFLFSPLTAKACFWKRAKEEGKKLLCQIT